MLPNNAPYLIGETAFHHQGDINYLKRLIDVAVDLKLDAVKFHLLFDVDDYFVQNHTAQAAIRKWIFTSEEWQEIIQFTYDKGIDVITLCNDVASLEWINTKCTTPIKAVEIHATGINDIFLLNAASKFEQTVILGVGGSSFDQIHFAINDLKNNNKNDIFLMYGFQNYPTDYKDINFSKIPLIKELFNLPVGYADHTDPKDPNNEFISVSAILKGINIIEKHFTLDVNEKRIDSQAAVSIDQMKKVKTLSNILHISNGDGSLNMSKAEIKYGDTGPMKKAIVARNKIPANTEIKLEDLAFKRTEHSSYLEQKEIIRLIGSKTIFDISKDEVIDYNNVEYKFNIAETRQFYNNK